MPYGSHDSLGGGGARARGSSLDPVDDFDGRDRADSYGGPSLLQRMQAAQRNGDNGMPARYRDGAGNANNQIQMLQQLQNEQAMGRDAMSNLLDVCDDLQGHGRDLKQKI